MSLINLNAFEILKLFNSNKISAVEYVSELISHIKSREPNVEAWAFLNEDLVKSQAKKIDEKLKNKEFTISKLSTENRELYGSVKPTEISKLIQEIEKLQVNPSMIQPVKEIKSLGSFEVILSLHSEIQTKIKIKVLSKEENQ